MDPYRALAQRLDTVPNGFPATESGAELRLLAKLFSPNEAALAAHLTVHPSAAADVANRAKGDEGEADALLAAMASRGLIHRSEVKGEARYALMPFIVGFYENQLPRMDVELAKLIEAYYLETKGAFVPDAPAVHRTVPVGEAIDATIEVLAYETATALIESAKSWGVQDCICRLGQRLQGKGCGAPLENCLTFAPVEGMFAAMEEVREISKDEALAILREADEAGLVHTVGNYRRGNHYICNCCTCCCGVLRRVAENGRPSAAARSAFRASVDPELCVACGACVERCAFGALSLSDMAEVDDVRCIGCGLCVSVCASEALRLVRRPDEEVEAIPASAKAWSKVRAERRRL